MTKQTKAQRLADLLDAEQLRTVSLDIMHNDAAAELRRLDALNAELVAVVELARTSHGRMFMSDPPRDAWKHFCVDAAIRNVLAKAKEQT